jgi:hypothetical protein
MSPISLNAISLLDEAILDSNAPIIIKAGPKLWSALKHTGRAYPCIERIAILNLDEKFNVILDDFQDAWGFSVHQVGESLFNSKS